MIRTGVISHNVNPVTKSLFLREVSRRAERKLSQTSEVSFFFFFSHGENVSLLRAELKQETCVKGQSILK